LFQNWLEEAIFLPFPGGQRTSAEKRVEFFPLLSKGRTQEQQNGKLMKIAGIKILKNKCLKEEQATTTKIITAHYCQLREEYYLQDLLN